ncbi:MAG: hypothetical protein HY928_15800, partial [Elusimicrobia bacterium]|nr:hypothetical protein [Elusimicrobiota bacterium]
VLPALRAAAPARARTGLRRTLGLDWVPHFDPRRGGGGLPVAADHPLVAAWGARFERGSWVYADVPVPAPGPGAYLLEAAAGRDSARTVVIVGDLAFEVKRSSGAALVYCADRRTGRPWAGARVWSLSAAQGEGRPHGTPVASGKTDAQGLWRGPAAHDALVLARSGAHFAAARADAPWGEDPSVRVYLYTDRPVYRPGHRVHFKGVVRRADGAGWLAERGSVKVAVRDPKGGLRLEVEKALSEAGTFDVELELPEEPPLGRWSVGAATAGHAESAPFEVQAYRKPEFKVSVAASSPSAILGAEAEFAVSGEFFHGGPTAGAAVEWTLTRVPFWTWRAEDPFAEDDADRSYEYGGRQVERGEGVLDADGRLSVRVPLAPEDGPWWAPRDFRFRLNARVTDIGGRQQSGEGSVLATRGDWSFALAKDRTVAAAGTELKVGVAARGYDGSAVEVPVEWSLERDGGEPTHTALPLSGGLLLPRGGAELTLRLPAPGGWRLVVRGRDAGGRLVEASEWLWASGPGTAAPAGTGRMVLLADKRAYKPGETARLVAAAPAGAPVRLSVEGRGVYRSWLASASAAGYESVVIPDGWSPSVRVSATSFSGGRLYRASRTLRVSPEKHLIKVSVEPDRPQAGPDEEVSFTVKARDWQDRPVDAEVSLGVVDAAVYALVPELAAPIEDFFHGPRAPRVSSSDSTQFWVQGRSRSGLAGEVALAEDFEGDDIKAGLAPARVRRRFEDTMTWVARLPTGPNGTATLFLRTPDNLTSWRATVRAADRRGRVGQGTGGLVTTKELLVRPQLPRFWVAGDEAEVGAVVQNRGDEQADVEVSLALAGPAALLDGGAPRLLRVAARGEARAVWRVRAAAAGEVKATVKALGRRDSDAVELTVPVKEHGVERAVSSGGRLSGRAASALVLPAGADPASARVTVHATASAAGALAQALPGLAGYPYGCVEQTMSRFGPTLAAARAFRELKLPADALPKDIDKMVGKGVARLQGFQHADGGWGWWKDDATHPFMSAYALWGLWQASREGGAVDGAALARGRESVERQLDASLTAGRDEDSGGSYGAGDGGPAIRAFMLFVLSHMEPTPGAYAGFAERMGRGSADMKPQTRALYSLALGNLGLNARAREEAGRLAREAARQGGTARWDGAAFDHGWREDRTQTTAAALRAVLAAAPKDPVAAEALHGLLLQRTDSGWASTQDTAAAAYALIDYLKAAPRSDAAPVLSARLNGGAPGTLALGGAVLAPSLPLSGVRAGENALELSLDGTGEVFYTASLSYRDGGEDLPEQGVPGLSLRRTFERLSPVRLAEGPGYRREGAERLRRGDLVLSTLEVDSDGAREFLMVEDFLPSGFEPAEGMDGAAIEGLDRDWEGRADQRERRDDLMALFLSRLPAGRTVLRTVLRAESAGRVHALPAVAQLPYQPDLRASSAEARLDVGD